jgi:hypothetical protein
VARKEFLLNTITTKKSTQRGTVVYLVVRPSLPAPRCGVPTDEGCTQPLSSDSMINLNTTVVYFVYYLSFARNLHNLELLALTNDDHKETWK